MTKQDKLNKYVAELIESSCKEKHREAAKMSIIWSSFYKEVKPEIGTLSLKTLKSFAYKYILSMVQFETICANAYSPISGCQSTSDLIINMYSSKDFEIQNNKELKP